jgi:hypothetical protein
MITVNLHNITEAKADNSPSYSCVDLTDGRGNRVTLFLDGDNAAQHANSVAAALTAALAAIPGVEAL